jgi:hypothetical protein
MPPKVETSGYIKKTIYWNIANGFNRWDARDDGNMPPKVST